MIGIGFVYLVAGSFFAACAVLGIVDRRWANALFHALLATSFFAGDRIGDLGNGVLVLALVAVATSGRMRRGEPAEAAPFQFGALVCWIPRLPRPARPPASASPKFPQQIRIRI